MIGRLKYFSNNSVVFNRLRYFITPFVIRSKEKVFLFDDSAFFKLNLNCRGDTFHGYVNMDERRSKGRVYVSPLDSLPFPDDKVRSIYADFEPMRAKRDFGTIFREWARVMVPNGILMMDNLLPNDGLSCSLGDAGFAQVEFSFQKDLPCRFYVYSPAENFAAARDFYLQKSESSVIICRDQGKGGDKIDLYRKDFGEDTLGEITIREVLEYIPPRDLYDLILRLKRALKPGGRIDVSVKKECPGERGKLLSFFDKGILARYFTEAGFLFDRLEFSDTGRIKAVARKKGGRSPYPSLPLYGKKKICAIGQYMMNRYNHLGFGWDEIPRAMDDLNIDYLLLEGMRNMDIKAIHKAILDYRPDYILLVLKETIPLLYDIAPQLKKMGTRVMFWFSDPEHPVPKDLSGIIDVMFLTNRGQLSEYREAYNLKEVYYMPQGSSRYHFYRRRIPEIYDVGFTGAVSKAPLHSTRRRIFDELARGYTFKAMNNVRNNVPEFYSSSKMVLGGSDFNYELYTSNRFYVALGCGACYITKKFPSIELLAEKGRHLLWFEEEEELFELIDYYLEHSAEREKIRANAQKLALDKHTYAHRIKNMLDIAEGKTKEFQGFL